MMVDYQEVIQLLSDIENPSKAQKVAQQIERRSDDPHFMLLLQQAIRDQKLPPNTQLASAIVLSRVISEKCSGWNQHILIECLLNIVTDRQVQYRLKATLEENLTTVMELSSQHYFQEVMLKAAEIIFLLPKEPKNMEIQYQSQDGTHQLKVAILILRCLLNSNAHFPILSKAIQQSLLEATLKITPNLSVKNINAMISLSAFWKQVIQKAKAEVSNEHIELLKWLSRNQLLTEWMLQIYHLDQLSGQLCYINPQSNLDHSLLNDLKTSATNLHSNILIGLQRSRQTTVEEVASRHLSQISTIINTICAFSSHKTLCAAYNDFVTGLIGVLILMLKQQNRYFVNIYDRLLHIIVFPLLGVTEEEELLFAQDPQEFNNLSEDCCDRQCYGILKTQTARLLETICDEIKGASQYIIQHAIISIKVRLALDQNFSQSVQNFLPLEEALFILAILSYRFSKHQRELYQLRLILTTKNLIEKASPLELARIFQFLAYNYQQLYPDWAQGEQWIYLALTTSNTEAEKHPTLAYAALDFISNVIENYFTEQFVLAYLQHSTVNNQIQFKILLKLISKHTTSFSENTLCLALDRLLHVVLLDVSDYQQHKKSHTMDITHSLQTVRRIAQKSNYLMNKSALKAKLWEFVEHLQKFRRINLDDEIIKIITAFVKWQEISTQTAQIIPEILQFYKSSNYAQTAYIILINQIALRVTHPITAGLLPPLLESTEQLLHNIMANPTSVTDNLALGTTLLVLQHIVVVFGESFNKEILTAIAETTLKIILTSDQPQDRTQPIILARSLNLLFLCHMHNRDERALSKLLLFQDAFLFRGHDLQVLAACLAKQIFREGDIVAVTQMIKLLVNAIWKAQEDSGPQVKSKLHPSKKTKPTVIRIKKLADYEACLKSMLQPFSSTLIPQLQLKETIDKMRTSNPLLFQAILRSLPNNISQHLRHLISEVTIEGRKRKIVRPGDIKANVNHNHNGINHNPPKRSLEQSQSDEALNDSNEDSPKTKRTVKKKLKEESHRAS